MNHSATIPTLDQREFEARLDEHRGIVFKIANTYCPGGEERDDLVQEICLQLWRSYPSYDAERRFPTWLYRAALKTAISFARGGRANRPAVPVPARSRRARPDARHALSRGAHRCASAIRPSGSI